VVEAAVQERRPDDAVEPVELARLDPVAVEPFAGGLVDHLDDPHQRRQRRDDEHAADDRRLGTCGLRAHFLSMA
jgi:hypothetical protein